MRGEDLAGLDVCRYLDRTTLVGVAEGSFVGLGDMDGDVVLVGVLDGDIVFDDDKLSDTITTLSFSTQSGW